MKVVMISILLAGCSTGNSVAFLTGFSSGISGGNAQRIPANTQSTVDTNCYYDCINRYSQKYCRKQCEN